MISVKEALQIVLSQPFISLVEEASLTEASGRVLAEEIFADRNFPPMPKVTMDGIAIRYEDWFAGVRNFPIFGTQFAGNPPLSGITSGNCIEIMTGAALPNALDTVIRYEDVEISDDGKNATVSEVEVQKGQNIQPEGKDRKIGDCILAPGSQIDAATIAVLASVGKAKVKVRSLPSVAVIATGDELVAVEETPANYQVRTSNTWAIGAALQEWNISYEIFHLKDEKAVLQEKLALLMDKFDAIILSGGVSKGKADFVPEVLASLGVEKLFHRVAQKPGKPFWFGKRGVKNFVFAFPGNPVSTFLCFHKYFLPWLRSSLGLKTAEVFAQLDADFSFAPPLTYFLQVSIYQKQAVLMATPQVGMGSGDFANLTLAQAFLELPPERSEFKAGEVFPAIIFGSESFVK